MAKSNKYRNTWFAKVFGPIFDNLGSYFDNWLKQVSGSGITQRDTEVADKSLDNTRILNEEEYDRKIDFFERFESPAARVRQYKEAGLNPMLLAGNGASVSASGGVGSAGSAPASGTGDGATPGILSSMLGFLKFGLEKQQTRSEVLERETRTSAQRIENKYREQRLQLEYEKLKADRDKVVADTANVKANLPLILANTDYAQTMALYAPEYFDATIGRERSEALRNASQVKLNEKEISNLDAVIKVHEKELHEIDAKIVLMQSEAALNFSRKNLTEQEIIESQERIKKMEKEIEEIGTKIGLNNKEIQYYIWNHPRQNSAFGLRWLNSSSDGTQRNKLSPEITDDELLMYVRERFGYDAAEGLSSHR